MIRNGAPKLLRTKAGVWYVSWTEARRSYRKSLRTADAGEARRRFSKWLAGGDCDTDKPDATVAECWAEYLRKPVADPLSRDRNWDKLSVQFADLRPAELTQTKVDAYVSKRLSGDIGAPSRPQTARKELASLRAALAYCAQPPRSLIAPAGVPVITLPPQAPPRSRWLRPEEVKRLTDTAAAMRNGANLSRVELFLWIAAETAARKGAIMDLTWERVDFDAGVIDFENPDRPATKKRRATVPISKALRPILVRAKEEAETPNVMAHKSDVWRSLKLVAARAGVEGVSPHVLRHSAATQMAGAGVPLWKIAKIMGNTVAVVENVYAKWSPDAAGTVDLISGGPHA